MKKEQLLKILKDISAVKIAVLGDFCCDAYWFIDEAMSEISVETNQATRPVRQQRYSLGGAGNVTNNLNENVGLILGMANYEIDEFSSDNRGQVLQ